MRRMLKSDVIAHFGSANEAAAALGITKQAISAWGEIIPRGSAYIVQGITKGKLKVDPANYPPKKKLRESEVENPSVKSSTPANRLTAA